MAIPLVGPNELKLQLLQRTNLLIERLFAPSFLHGNKDDINLDKLQDRRGKKFLVAV